ncbi:MFS transporter [Ideonella sp. DXS22W]|uniref:MFS transporter n=1 Tax=Pseudaquabacterium inlustre TaxID=2984192 RepID=A0ABU9CLM9_9BURK
MKASDLHLPAVAAGACSTTGVDPADVNRLLTLRLILPFLGLIVLNSLDRVNVGFAALRMNAELGFSPATYGFGVGLFFAGYMVAQVPSMWLLQRYGMRRWMCGVVLSWGLVATATAFVQDATSFFALRFALGLAEAGFAPGVTWCCARWVPQRFRGGAIGLTMVAIPLSVVIGGPLSGWLMEIRNPLGLPGWRFMILAEGLPTVLLGVALWWWVVDSPEQATWLTPAQQRWLADTLRVEARGRSEPHATESQLQPSSQRMWQALRPLLGSTLFWGCALVWFSLLTGAYGLMYWLPLVIKQASGQGALAIGWLSALPWVGVAAGMLLNPRHSDRSGERHLHIAVPALVAALALVAAAFAPHGALALALLVAAGLGLGAAQGTFWTLPTSALSPAALPMGIALVNMAGNLGGLLGPSAIGALRQATGSYQWPVLAVAAVMGLGAVVVLAMRPSDDRRP